MAERLATDRQITYLKALTADAVTHGTEAIAFKVNGAQEYFDTALRTKESLEAYFDRGDLTMNNASKAIDFLVANNREVKKLITEAKATAVDRGVSAPKTDRITEDGMYKQGEDIYKVQYAVNGSGRLYAKKLVVVTPAEHRPGDGKIITAAKVRFDYDRGAVYRLTPDDKMTLEEAKAFGALYGTCCVCGRTLTNEDSIEAGIGPICGGRF